MRVVVACMVAGLVKGEGFAVDASVIEANASHYHGKATNELGSGDIYLNQTMTATRESIECASPASMASSSSPAATPRSPASLAGEPL